jgi:hypothetical protein
MKHINKTAIFTWVLLLVILISSITINIYLLVTMGDNTPIKQQSTKLESNIKDHLDKTLEERLLSEEKVRGLIEEYTESGKSKVIDNTGEVIHGRDGMDGKDGSNGKDGESIVGPKGEKGDKGEPGYTPVKGVDYFDGEPIFIQCNVEINAWQQRLPGYDDWELLNGVVVPCLPR